MSIFSGVRAGQCERCWLGFGRPEQTDGRLSKKIIGPQHHGSVGLGLLFEELTRRTLFNYFAQPYKLIYALIWPHITPGFKIIHRRGADRAQNYIALIEHREFNDRPIEVVTSDFALLKLHCKCSILEGVQPRYAPATLPVW